MPPTPSPSAVSPPLILRRRSVFRPAPLSAWAYLKVFGPPAKTLFDAMTGPEIEVFSSHGGADERRRGLHLLASTANVSDPWVVELRFRKDPVVLDAPDTRGELHHALLNDRTSGWAEIANDVLTITGRAAAALERLLGRPTSGIVAFDVVDASRGQVRLRP